MQSFLETSRLRLSAPVAADIPALFRFFGDAQAMRLTQVSANVDDCALLVNTHEQQREVNGCAPWVIRERISGTIVGWGGLYEDPFDKGWGIELGYRFAPSAWGKGYATELAVASLNAARSELALNEVVAFSHPENTASHNVLRKTGFTQDRFLPQMNRFLYKMQLN